jgi:3-dehydroquinate synthase
MKIIRNQNYSIYIGDDIKDEIQLYFRGQDVRDRKIVLLVDENTEKHCLPHLLSILPIIENAPVVRIAPGEHYKVIGTCLEIWESLLDIEADRKTILLNLGGGVVTDVGGFVASTYKRGIRFINVPTTLVGQVDAAFGGKTGVNMRGLKNQIGVFSDPAAVFVIPSFIFTLPKQKILSGFAEMIKHALIMDSNYWEMITSVRFNEIENWEQLIIRSIEIKNSVATNDPFEKSLRRRLNFGHTIGHAFETLALMRNNSSFTHGHAVAMGIICESYLSYRLRGLPIESMEKIISYMLLNYEYFQISPNDYPYLLESIKHDKKNRDGKINFTLLPSIGNARIDQWCDEDMIVKSFEFYSKLA